MKQFLPKLLICFGFIIAIFFIAPNVHAQTTTATTPPEGHWVEDQEVTFVGKTASRSDDFLNWTLQNYDWACVKSVKNGANSAPHCDNSGNPIETFWVEIRNIVFVFLILFVLAAAFIIIISRGQNLTIMRFIPRFILVLVLVVLSYSLVQFIYQSADVVEGCFLRVKCQDTTAATHYISTTDLLNIAFDYNNFTGYRKIGGPYEESAFISLLLVRLTAFTYYVMTGVLLVRKVILWFFIIISAIFPLLLFYSPLRNTAKIWVGEFFRWLLYAPLFAIFLHGLVVMWSSTSGIPLPFSTFVNGQAQPCDPAAQLPSCYPTSINILLGGPGQIVSSQNSVNTSDSFALYVISLLMLWVVILLPFLLLNIFLDYLKSISFKDNTVFRQIVSRGRSFLGRPPSPAGSPNAPPSQSAGMARSLPFLGSTGSAVRTIPISTTQSTANLTNIQAATEIMKLTNLSVPKMRDIARYETSMMSRDTSRQTEISHMANTLEKIANPQVSTSSVERERFNTMREKLVEQKQKGDPLATSILNASNIVTQKSSTATQTTNLSQIGGARSTTTIAGKAGVPVSQIGNKVQQFNAGQAKLPVVNKVQQVSLEDYEEVRKLWEENYRTLEPPKSIEGHTMTRREWIKSDVDRATQAVNLLTAIDPVKNKEGMDMVANILPFLLIGGFSRSEVIAYLKAKLEAAKSSLSEVQKKEEEEETMVDRNEQQGEEKKKMTMEAEEQEQKDAKKPDENPVFSDEKKEEVK